MRDYTIIVPYLFENEIDNLQKQLRYYPVLFEQDVARIGSDLMFEKMWNSVSTDIFILHSDMVPTSINFMEQIIDYINKYPDYGMYGCKLIYPRKDNGMNILQSYGGKFTNCIPDHYGSGWDMITNKKFKELVNSDDYNDIMEVSWTTFGGIYIKREVIDSVGNFDRSFIWTYNRDVDYCLTAREKGYKILQIPVEIVHFESKDNKRLMMNDKSNVYNEYWSHNLKRLQEKWGDKLND